MCSWTVHPSTRDRPKRGGCSLDNSKAQKTDLVDMVDWTVGSGRLVQHRSAGSHYMPDQSSSTPPGSMRPAGCDHVLNPHYTSQAQHATPNRPQAENKRFEETPTTQTRTGADAHGARTRVHSNIPPASEQFAGIHHPHQPLVLPEIRPRHGNHHVQACQQRVSALLHARAQRGAVAQHRAQRGGDLGEEGLFEAGCQCKEPLGANKGQGGGTVVEQLLCVAQEERDDADLGGLGGRRVGG